MKHFPKIITAMVLLLATTSVMSQQGELKLGINYNLAMPVGTLKDKIPDASYRGWSADILYGINDKISVGLGTGYQDFYQKNERQVYKGSDGSDISAVLTHSIQTIPILLKGKYYFTPGAKIQPFAALGIGGNLVMFRELLGEFGGTETKLGFAARPEAGVYIPISKSRATGINIGASYNFMPFNHQGFENLNSLGVHAGIAFPLRR